MSRTVHVDLTEADGCDTGSWMELRDPKAMRGKVFDALLAKFNALGTAGTEEAERFLRGRVSAWHIAFKDEETGEDFALNDPSKDDLGDLPKGVSAVLMDKIVELFQATVPLALRTR